MERSRWTDERLDDLSTGMREGFDRADRRFDQVDRRFEQIHEDIRGIHQTVQRGWITMMSLQIVGFLGVIATILARGA